MFICLVIFSPFPSSKILEFKVNKVFDKSSMPNLSSQAIDSKISSKFFLDKKINQK